MNIVIATAQVPLARGGAEILVTGLEAALRNAGHEVEVVAIPFKWYPPERILDHMLACRLLDLTEANGRRVDRLIALKFPAYFIPHPDKTVWLLHQHRQAYEQWEHPALGDLIRHGNAAEVRDAILSADRRLLPESRHIFTISRNVSSRLESYCGIPSTPLYHPPGDAEHFHCAPAEDYFLVPGRITAPKRQMLAVEALAQAGGSFEMVLCGAHESAEYTRELIAWAEAAGVADRLRLIGHVTPQQKIDLYARCIGVLYVPFDEDYGYVTLEAMLASKALITCIDSGGPLEFIVNGESGVIVDPTPEAVAAALCSLSFDRARAAALGRAGHAALLARDITWRHVVEELTQGNGV